MSGDCLRRSAEYRRFVESILERDHHTCKICGEEEKELHVHHLLPYASYKELRMDPGNVITICKDCHGMIHGRNF